MTYCYSIMKLVNNIKEFQPLDWALLMNAVSIMYLKAVPYFLTLLLIVLIIELIRGKVSWGNSGMLILFTLSTPILLGAIGLISSENTAKGLEECSRLLPFFIFPVVFNFWKPKNYNFFKKTALSIFAIALTIRLIYNFYESLLLYNKTGEAYHLFYTYFVQDINIVSIFMFFAILYIVEYYISSRLTRKQLFLLIFVLAILSVSMILLQGRIVLLGFWIALILLFFIYRKFSKKWILLIILSVTMGAFFIPNFQSRFSKINKNLTEKSQIEVPENGEHTEKIESESMLLKTVKKHSNTLNLVLSGAFFMLILYFTPFYKLVPHFLAIYLIGSLVVVFASSKSDNFNQRTDALVAKQEKGELFSKELSTSEKQRLNALLTTIELIKERPLFGYGTGDWRDALTVRYYEKQLKRNFIEQTAPHNQYLRTWLRHGAFGLLAFLAYLFWLLKKTVNHYQVGRYALVLCVILSALGYDVFDVGGSIPFIAYFSCLLFMQTKPTIPKLENQ